MKPVCLATVALIALALTAAAGPLEDFRALCQAKAAEADKANTMTVTGADGWYFLGKELRHLSVGTFWGEVAAKVSRADKPEKADPLPAILDFKAQLDKAGIALIMIPVPAKVVVYPDKLDAKLAPTPRLDASHQEFFALLRKDNITVIDLTDDLIARRNDKDGAMFCQQDTHWSGRACELAARTVAELVKGQPWTKDLAKQQFKAEVREVQVQGDLVRDLTAGKPGPETLPLRFITTADGALVEPSADSPVVLLGDSHCLVFHGGGDMLAEGAGLADQLAMELGVAVDLLGTRGSGATPARVNLMRQARANLDYLAKKKLIVWCFTVREFTESSGWSKVPVVK